MRDMLGIVILNYNTWRLTIECVKNIEKNVKLPYRIYIVDNASPNDSYGQLKQYYQDNAKVECILSEENGGYAKGNNIGIQCCKNDGIAYALICNNDVQFKSWAIERMYSTITEYNAVVVSPKILGIDGQVNSNPFSGWPTIAQYLNIKSSDNLRIDAEDVTEVMKVYSVPGSCMMIDVEKFTKMGAFDEGTFMYCEEGTVARQAAHAGYTIVYDPKAEVIHCHGASTGKKNIFIDSNILCSSLYLWKRYGNASNLQITYIYIFFMTKMLLKVLFHRIDAKGTFAAIKKCQHKLREILRMKEEDII